MLYSTLSLSKEAGVTQANIRMLCSRGTIKAQLINSTWIINQREAKRYLEKVNRKNKYSHKKTDKAR